MCGDGNDYPSAASAGTTSSAWGPPPTSALMAPTVSANVLLNQSIGRGAWPGDSKGEWHAAEPLNTMGGLATPAWYVQGTRWLARPAPGPWCCNTAGLRRHSCPNPDKCTCSRVAQLCGKLQFDHPHSCTSSPAAVAQHLQLHTSLPPPPPHPRRLLAHVRDELERDHQHAAGTHCVRPQRPQPARPSGAVQEQRLPD